MNNGNQSPVNGNYQRPRRTLSNPRTFFTPPTTELLQSIASDLLSSQIDALKDGYESRISQLNQEICHLRSSGQQTLHSLGQQCAKLKGELLKKHSELKTLKQSKYSRKSVRDANTQIQFDKCSRHCDRKIHELREKLAKLRDNNDILTKKKLGEEICSQFQISELQQSNKKLREENQVLKTNLKGNDTKQLKSDLDASQVQMESFIAALEKTREDKNTLGQEKKDLEAKCAKLNDELLKKDSELEALKQSKERNSHEFQLKFNQMEIEKEANANSIAKLNESMAQVERDYISFVNSFSSQTSKLNEKNNKLKEENEMLRADHKDLNRCKRELVLEKIKKDHLQVAFDNLEVELQESRQKLRKTEDANSELMQKLNETKSISEQLQIDLDNQTSELQNCRDRLKKADQEYYELNLQVNNLEDELDQKGKEMLRLQKLCDKTKAELDICQADFENALADISRVVDERDGLKVELESASANSQELKAELEVSKKSIEELTIKFEKLKAECQRPSNFSVPKAKPRNVCKFPLNLPGPSSVMTAVKRTSVDLNATIVLNDTIDLTKMDDTMSPSSSKKTRKSE